MSNLTPEQQKRHDMLMALIEGSSGYTARSYSGRGMCGLRCVGISTDDSDTSVVLGLARVAIDDDDIDTREALNLIGRMQSDALGMGSIYYWTSVPWASEGDGDDDDDR